LLALSCACFAVTRIKSKYRTAEEVTSVNLLLHEAAIRGCKNASAKSGKAAFCLAQRLYNH
jgi:hypothetical protein